MGPLSPRKRLVLRLALTVSLVTLGIALVDRTALLSTLAAIPLWVMVAAVLILWVQVALGALRWFWVAPIVDLPLSFRQAWTLHSLNVLTNCVVPGNLGGDGVRAAFLLRAGHPKGAIFASLLLDRAAALTGLFVFSTLFGLATWFDNSLLISAVAAVCTVVAFAMYQRPRSKGVLLVGLASTGVFVLLGCIMAVFAVGLGIQAPINTLWSALPAMVLVTVLPLSVGGWGVREWTLVGILSPLGIPTEQAIALGVCLGTVLWFGGLPGAIAHRLTLTHAPEGHTV